MKFEKSLFCWDGLYLTYGSERKFVARFKRASDKSGFLTFLIKNFSVEEYFLKLADQPPVKVLEEKGYISATVKKVLVSMGYRPTIEGKQQYLNNLVGKN